MPVFGFVLVHGAVGVRVRVLVRRLVVLVLVVVVGVTVLVGMLHAVGVPVRMLVLLSHGRGFGPPGGPAYCAASAPGNITHVMLRTNA